MTGNTIELEAVSKRYFLGEDHRPFRSRRRNRDEIWPLRNVSLEVAAGEVLGVVGRNGAGKSTLLKVIGRITEPTGGVSRTRGRIGSLLEVGTGFHPELTGRENIYLNGAIFGMRRRAISARFNEIATFAGVERFLDTPLKRYSAGMYLRLAFAVVVHLDVDILLVDEVLAVGDLEYQRRCLARLSDAAGDGRTVVFVSHDLDALSGLCPASVWLENGVVAARGPTAGVLAAYRSSGTSSNGDGRLVDGTGSAVSLEGRDS